MDTRPPSVAVREGKLADVFSQCHDDIDVLYRRFLQRHVAVATSGISGYIMDARAFLVLSNGSLEQCCEDLLWAAAHGAVDQYMTLGRVTRTLAGLLIKFAKWPSLPEDEASFVLAGQRDFRSACGEVLTEVGKFVQRNQGVSPYGVGMLFQPLAVTISPTATQVDSLIQLRKYRGDSAHTRGALSMPPPTEVKRFVYDVLQMARTCTFNVTTDINAGLGVAVRMCVPP